MLGGTASHYLTETLMRTKSNVRPASVKVTFFSMAKKTWNLLCAIYIYNIIYLHICRCECDPTNPSLSLGHGIN